MAWKNNNNRSGNTSSNGSGNRNTSDKQKKTTGCKRGQGAKSGNPWVSGWNLQQRRGMLSFLAFPYQGTSIHTSENNKEWENWVAKIKLNGIPQTGVMPCLYERATGRVIFKEMGMVANPNKNYFGTFTKD